MLETDDGRQRKVGVSRTGATPTPFAPAQSVRAVDAVLGQLRARIRDGELRPGDRLPAERALAEQFQVSRNMVREALRMLEVAGIIELRKGATGGAFIRQGQPDVVAQSLSDMLRLGGFRFDNVTEARVWLSRAVVSLCCERATSDDLDELEANVAEADKLARTEEWDKVAELNIEFHHLLARFSGNPVLEMIQRALMEVMRNVSRVAGPILSDQTIESRKRLLGHLRARDVEPAVAEIEVGLNWVHKYFLEHAPAGL